MQITQSRRDFLVNASLAAAAGVLGARGALADEGPPETTSIRIAKTLGICSAPQYIAEALLAPKASPRSPTCGRLAA